MCSDSLETYSGKSDTVVYLKKELRKRKLLVSGRKKELVKRLRDYDVACQAAPIVQKIIRGWLVRLYMKRKGPALLNRQLCVNKLDFYTQEKMEDISLAQFFSICDNNNLVYGFNLISFMNLRLGRDQIIRNPYTNEEIDKSADLYARATIRQGRCLGLKVVSQISFEPQSDKGKTVDFFQELARMSFTVNSDWVDNMTDNNLRRFDYLLRLHWRRASFSNDLRRRICPPSGTLKPFDSGGLPVTRRQYLDNVLSIGRQLSFGSNSIEDRRLGATVFLSVLTKLSGQASIALPWFRTAADQFLFPDDYTT